MGDGFSPALALAELLLSVSPQGPEQGLLAETAEGSHMRVVAGPV